MCVGLITDNYLNYSWTSADADARDVYARLGTWLTAHPSGEPRNAVVMAHSWRVGSRPRMSHRFWVATPVGFFRKIGRDRGATLQALVGQITATIDGLPPELGAEKTALLAAVSDVQGIMMTMMAKLGQSVYHVGLQGNRILAALAELVIGWRLTVNAKVALGKAASAKGDDVAFYKGKLAASRFYAKNVLPGIAHTRKLIEQGDLELMELEDDIW